MSDNFDFSKMSPAIAGFLVDRTVGYREVISAIVDLIQRGYIYYQSDKIALIKQDKKLLLHEKEILNQLFSGVELFPHKTGLDKFIDYKTIIAFIKIDCINSGLAYVSGKKDSPVYNYVLSPKDRYGTKEFQKQKLPVLIKQYLKSPVVIWTIIIFLLNIILGGLASFSTGLFQTIIIGVSVLVGFMFIFIIFLWVCFTIMLVIIYFLTSNIMLENFVLGLNPTGIKVKSKYVELKNFLIQHPTENDLNLSKEFIPYLIAFGHNTVWNERLEKLPFVQVTPKKNQVIKFSIVTSGSNVGTPKYVVGDKNLVIRQAGRVSEDYNIFYGKKITAQSAPKETQVGEINKGGILVNKPFFSEKFHFKAGKIFFDGQELLYEYGVLSNGKRPLLKEQVVTKSSNDVERSIEIYGDFNEVELINLIIALKYYGSIMIYYKNKKFIDNMKPKRN